MWSRIRPRVWSVKCQLTVMIVPDACSNNEDVPLSRMFFASAASGLIAKKYSDDPSKLTRLTTVPFRNFIAASLKMWEPN